MNYTTAIGFTAAFLTTIAFLPQVIQIWKTKSTKDINLKMYVILCTGVFLWILYGILILSWPVIIANVLVLALSSIILIFKVKYG